MSEFIGSIIAAAIIAVIAGAIIYGVFFCAAAGWAAGS